MENPRKRLLESLKVDVNSYIHDPVKKNNNGSNSGGGGNGNKAGHGEIQGSIDPR